METTFRKDIETKEDVDDMIRFNIDKVVALRFGEKEDVETMRLDEMVERKLSNLARFFFVEASLVPEYVEYFQITRMPATVFMFNCEHIRVNCGCTPDNTKFIGCFRHKRDLIDLIQALFDGAMGGKYIIDCPIAVSNIPKYDLIYKDI